MGVEGSEVRKDCVHKEVFIKERKFCILYSSVLEEVKAELNTGRFIMFSVITNTYNKKTKGPTLMELFTAMGTLKKFFLTTRDVRCVQHG